MASTTLPSIPAPRLWPLSLRPLSGQPLPPLHHRCATFLMVLTLVWQYLTLQKDGPYCAPLIWYVHVIGVAGPTPTQPLYKVWKFGYLHPATAGHSLYKTAASLGVFRNPSRDFYFFKLPTPQYFIMKNFKVQSSKVFTVNSHIPTIYIISLYLLYYITVHHLSLSIHQSICKLNWG